MCGRVWECGRRVGSQIDGQRQLAELQHVVEGLHVVAELGDQIDQFERLVGLLENLQLLLDLGVDRFDVRAERVRENLGFAVLTPKQ